MSPKRVSKTSYHHGDLKRALIEAALQLIADEGLKELSLRAIARRAGVSAAAPYRHFESRDAVLAEVGEQGFRLLSASIRRQTSRFPDDPIARLREAGVAYVRFAVDNPAHYSVMFEQGPMDPSAHPRLASASDEAFGLLVTAISDCQAAGLARATPSARQLATIAWAGVHGIASLVNLGRIATPEGRPGNVEQLARALGNALLDGLRTQSD